MRTVKVSDYMKVGETWTSEWEVDWIVVAVGDDYADVKRVGGRSIHRVLWREVECWSREGITNLEVAAMREP